MNANASRLFPLALMLALALVTFWLERAVREEQVHPSLRRHDPDFVVERFFVTTYGRGGRAESRLAAERMTHYPDDDSTELVEPRVVQTRPDEPRMTLAARRGAVSGDGEHVFLRDDVLLVRDADGTRAEARVRTEFLHFVRGRSLVRTDREVRIDEDTRRLRARGLEYSNDTGNFVLHADVRGVFEPRKKTP